VSDDAPPDNVLRPTFGQQSELAVEFAGTQRGYCRHTQYLLDTTARTVSCGGCGASLDAFQVLLDYARDERNWRTWDRECADKRKLVADLKAEETRVKSRTASASRKDATAAVAHERQATFVRRQAIAAMAQDVAELARRIVRLARIETRADVGRRLRGGDK
jgi:hypothetical protein